MAYAFGGSNYRISGGNNLGFDWDDPFTIAFWMRPGSYSTVANIVSKQLGVSPYSGYGILLNTAGKLQVRTIHDATERIDMISTSTVQLLTWTHVCATKDSASSTTSFNLYINGVADILTATGKTHTSSILNNANFTLSSRNSTDLWYAGRLAEVGVWDVELSAEEAASLATVATCEKVRPQNLQFYAPLVRDVIDAKGTPLSNNGAPVKDHPRIYG